jgi:phenylpropionate dioxygenase-like ring-hydroxylating dioxygenase large terminal subunit
MSRYLNDPAAVAALVRDDEVHRDVYTSQEIYDLEMRHLFRRAWIYLGHESQVAAPGDYLTVDVAGQPLILLRHQDGSLQLVHNRCAHKGAKLISQPCGNTGKYLRCPYHAWSYRTDGSLIGIPLKQSYDNTRFGECPAAQGLSREANVESYRGFVFARLSPQGPTLREYFGASLTSIDNMVDRSPQGELEIAGGVLRYLHNCNWKMFVENLNDTMHPMVAHESSAGTAKALWAGQPEDVPKPMAIEQFVPFASSYQFFDDMGVRVFANGHSYTGVNFSIHSKYSAVPQYEAVMVARHGAERAAAILREARHNTVYYPSLTIKGAIQAIRVARPLGPDRTVVESYTFKLKGAPDVLHQRTMMYSRLINSPMSVVGHDDLYVYRAIQEGLAASGNDWISLHRDYDPGEAAHDDVAVKGTSEVSMRNQFRAWARHMTEGVDA